MFFEFLESCNLKRLTPFAQKDASKRTFRGHSDGPPKYRKCKVEWEIGRKWGASFHPSDTGTHQSLNGLMERLEL